MCSNQAVIIALMGIAGLLMALVTGEIYKHLALDNQRANMYNLLEYKTNEEIEELSEVVNELGLSIQHHPGFRAAFNKRDRAAISDQLNNQFNQYFVTAGIIDLEKLLVFDMQFNFIAGSSNGASYNNASTLACTEFLERAKLRTGADKLRVLSDVCTDQKTPLYVAIIPVGGLVPKGYIMLTSQLMHTFKDIEEDLSMPLRVVTKHNNILYNSDKWPDQYEQKETLEAEFILREKTGREVARIKMLDHMVMLKKRLDSARMQLILFASGITAIAMIIAFLLMNHSVLSPMKTLLTQLQLIRKDRKYLGKRIHINGNTEIVQLAEGFNDMSEELGELYHSLEKMAFTDPLTSLYNRAWFHESLLKCIKMSTRHDNPFAVFIMDLNKFKPINDNYGHHIGDLILEKVSMRMQEVLRGEDTLARLTNHKNNEFNDEIIARIGGDEFAVLLPMVDNVASIEAVAKKLLHAIERPIQINDTIFKVGMSIGIAMYPQQGVDGNLLLRRADEAMYLAKNNGTGYEFSQSVTGDLHVIQ